MARYVGRQIYRVKEEDVMRRLLVFFQSDPPEEEVPYCTLKSFPSQIEHCIQWARDKVPIIHWIVTETDTD